MKSDCVSVRLRTWNNSASILRICAKFYSLACSQKLFREISRCNNKYGYFTWRPAHIYGNISLNTSQKMRNVSDKTFRGNLNIHFIYLFILYILLTVYLNIFILILTNLMHKMLFYNKFISYFYMFRAHVLIARRPKLYYTVSGIITPIGGRPVHGTAPDRCDDTRDCIIQFWPPDDEHMCSKHVEVWNKLIIKFSASSWLILR